MHGEGRGERSLEDETDLVRGASSFFFPHSSGKKQPNISLGQKPCQTLNTTCLHNYKSFCPVLTGSSRRGLGMKCPPVALGLTAQSPTCDAIWGGGGSSWRRQITGGPHLKAAYGTCASSLCSLSTMT